MTLMPVNVAVGEGIQKCIGSPCGQVVKDANLQRSKSLII